MAHGTLVSPFTLPFLHVCPVDQPFHLTLLRHLVVGSKRIEQIFRIQQTSYVRMRIGSTGHNVFHGQTRRIFGSGVDRIHFRRHGTFMKSLAGVLVVLLAVRPFWLCLVSFASSGT